MRAVLILLVIRILNFFLIHAAPGDPAAVMAGEFGDADPEFLEQLRQRFGLDQPIYVQLGIYLSHMAQLDLGFSYRQQLPVLQLIVERLPATLILSMSAFAVSLGLGILAGAMAAGRQERLSDTLISLFALVFYATPLFWLALMAVLLFSIELGWLPGFGYETVSAGYVGLARALDIARHLVLPVMTLGLFFMAIYVRMTRASMLEVSQMGFVKTAKAKGLRPRVIQRRHVLRNALLPVVTLAGLQAGQLVGGAVLIETVFAWPGHRSADVRGAVAARLQPAAGRLRRLRRHGPPLKPDHRRALPLRGSENPGGLMTDFWKRFSKHRGAVAGLLILFLIVVLAVAVPFLFPKSPWAMVQRPFLPPFQNATYFLGTDPMGRDLASGLAHGAYVSLLVGLVSTVISLLIGIPIGALAGYLGGLTDDILMRFTELFQSVPSFALAVVLVAIFQLSITSIDHRDRHRLLAAGRASAARRGDVAEVARFRRCGGTVGPETAHNLASDPAQHPVADHRARLHDGGRRHSGGKRAVLHGAGRCQRHVVGIHHRRRAHGDPSGLVGQLFSRPRHASHRADVEPRR